MELSALKEALGEQFAPLETYVNDLIGQRDAARKESIDGRKTLKAKVESSETAIRTLMEKLGIDSLDDLESLPAAKGQAEAMKQLETRLKKSETDAATKDALLSEIGQKYRSAQLDVAFAKALAAHEFVDAELVADHLKAKVEWDGDVPRVAGATLEEAVTAFAKAKPHLLKSKAAGGSGWNPNAGATPVTMTRAAFAGLAPDAAQKFLKGGGKVVD